MSQFCKRELDLAANLAWPWPFIKVEDGSKRPSRREGYLYSRVPLFQKREVAVALV